MPRSTVLLNTFGLHFRLFARLAVLACGAATASAAFAERLESPLELIYDSPNVLVAGRLVEINPTGRLVFARDEVLSSYEEPSSRVDARAPIAVLARVALGRRYLLVYSTTLTSPNQPGRLVVNPDGARLLVSNGLDPALFDDTPVTRRILRLGRTERGRESRRTLDELLATLGGRDLALQDLAASEIALNRELRAHLRPADLPMIETFVRDTAAPPTARTTLLELAAREPDRFGSHGWLDVAQDLVANSPLDGYASTSDGREGMVRSALGTLDRASVQLPPAILTRWARSDSSPIAESALLMLRRQAPERERPAVVEALADPRLPDGMRAFLGDHLRRLDLLEARLRSYKK